jgi:hypothetical protein
VQHQGPAQAGECAVASAARAMQESVPMSVARVRLRSWLWSFR